MSCNALSKKPCTDAVARSREKLMLHSGSCCVFTHATVWRKLWSTTCCAMKHATLCLMLRPIRGYFHAQDALRRACYTRAHCIRTSSLVLYNALSQRPYPSCSRAERSYMTKSFCPVRDLQRCTTYPGPSVKALKVAEQAAG